MPGWSTTCTTSSGGTRQSVSESWREFFADYVPGGHGGLAGSGTRRSESIRCTERPMRPSSRQQRL